MNILVLGGTKFVGRHIVETALTHEHQVTLFNRGQTAPDLFPTCEKLTGNRDGGLDVLRGRTWDAVVDVNGYVPRVVRASAELLSATGRYVFISSISVFSDFSQPISGEDAPLATLKDNSVEEITGETYGGLKVLCEQVVMEVFGEHATIIRPGYVIGPNDHTDRFTSWLRRIEAGGKMLAPGNPAAPLQVVDARDLAEFTIKTIEEGIAGVFNAVGPKEPLSWGECFERTKALTGNKTAFTWVSDAFLEKRLEAKEITWNEVAIWAPPDEWGGAQTNCSKAIANGLTFRPLEETVRDTLAWDADHGAHRCGFSAEREIELLAEWQKETRQE